jgi:hypothetical protein
VPEPGGFLGCITASVWGLLWTRRDRSFIGPKLSDLK